MIESSKLGWPAWEWIPSWGSMDNWAITPDYLDTAQDNAGEWGDKSDDAEAVEEGMFEISLVRALGERSSHGSVSPPADHIHVPANSLRSQSSNPTSIRSQKAPSSIPAWPSTSEPQYSRIHDAAFIFIVCMAQFLSLAGLAQSVAPLFIIGDSFAVSEPGQLSWYTAAYSLTVGTFILPAGRLGDMYGHKKMFLLGWFWFGLWSVIAGVFVYSGSTLFNIARGFQGIGPAILVPNAMALIGKTYPMGLKKNMVFSAFGAGGPTGFVVGAAFSALFSELAWWPWSFWALAIACFVCFIFALFVTPADRRPSAPADEKGKAKFDWLGAFTGVGGLVLINVAWNQGPVVGWDAPYVYVLLIIGVLSMAAFFVVELRFTRHPLIPIRGLKKEAGFALACIAAGWGSHGIWIYYIFWFLLQLRRQSALLTAAQTSPVAPVGAAFALSVGFLMKKMRPAYIMLIAMILFLVGSVLIATTPVEQIYWAQTFLSILIMPGGMNLSFPAGTILLSNALPKENQGIAASLVSTIVNYSISIGLGFAGTIDRYTNPDSSAPGGLNVLRGFRGAWWFGAGLDGIGLVIALYFVWISRPTKSDGKIKCLKTAILHEKEKRAARQQKLSSQASSLDSMDLSSLR